MRSGRSDGCHVEDDVLIRSKITTYKYCTLLHGIGSDSEPSTAPAPRLLPGLQRREEVAPALGEARLREVVHEFFQGGGGPLRVAGAGGAETLEVELARGAVGLQVREEGLRLRTLLPGGDARRGVARDGELAESRGDIVHLGQRGGEVSRVPGGLGDLHALAPALLERLEVALRCGDRLVVAGDAGDLLEDLDRGGEIV